MTSIAQLDDFFNVCRSCNTNCCRNARPPITKQRRNMIEAFLRERQFSTENLFEQKTYVFPKEDMNGYCIFYDEKTRKCRIHPVKPETCVAGPITFDINVRTGKIEWYLKKEKICPLAGLIFSSATTLQKHLKTAKRQILKLLFELDAEALQALMKIEEPETFKIDEDPVAKAVLNKLQSTGKASQNR